MWGWRMSRCFRWRVFSLLLLTEKKNRFNRFAIWNVARTGNMRHSPSEPALHQPPGRSLSTSRSSSLTRPGAAAAAAASHRPDVASSSTPPPPPSSSTLAGRHAHFNNNNNNHINRSSHNGHHSPLYGAGHGPASQATPPPLVQPFGSCVISDRPAGLDLDDFLPVRRRVLFFSNWR